MNKYVFLLMSILTICHYTNAQNIRWSYKVDGSFYGAGKPWTFSPGYWKWTAAVFAEDNEGESNGKQDPEMLHYYFMPFDAKQLVVIENYNPGAIEKIEIVYQPPNSKKTVRKEVYSNTAKRSEKDYVVHNIMLENITSLTDVWITMNYRAVEGINQIAAVGLTDLTTPYTPQVNLLPYDVFEEGAMYMHDDVSGKVNPTTPIITVDNKYMYFNHKDQHATHIYRGTIGNDGSFSKVVYSDFNLPDHISTHSGIRMVSQDNNLMYVTPYDLKTLVLYKVFMTREPNGKDVWHHEHIKVKGYESGSDYQNELFSYDGKYLLVRMESADKKLKDFGADIYVAKKQENGHYGMLKRIGDAINTIGDEIPCYLAPDNKTLYFSSNGHLGFGKSDIYMSRRLDDSWENWSQPINLGPAINTTKEENYFTMDAASEYAYFIRWNAEGSDLFRLKFREAKVEENIKPEPVIVITGRVLNKKTNKAIFAEIKYLDLKTGEVLGEAISNSQTGNYSIALPHGINYAYEAKASGFLPVSENINTTGMQSFSEIERNLYLVPNEIGQTIRLNNIFFDHNQATLKDESKFELEKLYTILIENKSMKIEISGHTDNVGSEVYNHKLSENRAKAVMEWLINKGIPEKRLAAKGYGESRPLATNETTEGKAMNRRVEFTILEN